MRKIRLPSLAGLFGTGQKRAPRATRTREPAGPVGRGRIVTPGPRKGTRAQLAERPEPRRYGARITPAGDRKDQLGGRNYPARSERLRTRPEVRAGTRFQLAERHETLASSRRRRPPQGIAVPKARRQLAARPHRGTQLRQYPEPYERTPARPAPRTAPRTGAGLDRKAVPRQHAARGVVPRPPARLPGDATPTGRAGGSRAGASPHPYWSKR